MRRSDGLPKLIVMEERSKRETLELCGDEQNGLRCMLVKGHGGLHECLASAGVTRWPSQRAS